MSDPQSKSIERYIEQALIRQMDRVFGVQTKKTKRSDFKDVMISLGNRNTDRAVGLCFLRATGFQVNREGYRPNALVTQGMRGSVAKTIEVNGKKVPAEVNVVHPIPTIFEYEVSFSVAEYSDAQRLWALWMQAGLQSLLAFRVKYQDLMLDVAVDLDENMSVPEWGEPGEDREDQVFVQSVLQVKGYTEAVTDSHVVPIILYPDLQTNVSS